MKNKIRLDVFLVEKKLALSGTAAQAIIMDGRVSVNGVKIIKPSELVKEEDIIEIKEKLKYVSRGALKIEKAYKEFNLDARNKVVIDIGASTGGFTDFLIQNGAKRVYAVDVGYGQLDYKLRKCEKVISLEKLNARYLSGKDIKEKADLITIDTSFISVVKFLKNLIKFLKQGSLVLILIKPQFEAERKFVLKGGVVKDKQVHKEIIKNITVFAEDSGLFLYNLTISPIKGPAGNVEYLALFGLNKSKKINFNSEIDNVVN